MVLEHDLLHPEQPRYADLRWHLDQRDPPHPVPLPEGHDLGKVVAGVAEQDEVGRLLAPPRSSPAFTSDSSRAFAALTRNSLTSSAARLAASR